MKRSRIFVSIIVLLGYSIVIPWGSLLAFTAPAPQDTKTLLFQEAQLALDQARSGQADVFSPEQYTTALRYFQQAEADFEKNKSLESVREKVKMAEVYFSRAAETAKLFQSHFGFCSSARADALNAEAPQFRQEAWAEAEKALEDAAKTLERGNLNSARNKAERAEALYRQVELESIKANFLDETRNLLAAGEKDLKKFTPATFTKAGELVDGAEKTLADNRYDTDQARQLAQEAKYEAAHASYLSAQINRMRDEEITIEQLFLDSELPLQRISDELDLNPRFDEGPQAPTDAIIEEIREMKRAAASLRQDLSDRQEQIDAMAQQISQMESQLGDLKSKEATLSQLMEQQRIAREKFNRIQASFTTEEAEVVRVGDDVIIRLYGLTFPVGQSTIEPQYFGLLTKVLKATDEYPGCRLTIEGHTDSWGSDQTNQTLSTERANAVSEYFLATAGLDASKISAIGHGESKPIASNETKDGRRKNRRIETIIHTK